MSTKKNPGRFYRDSEIRSMKLEVAKNCFEQYAAIVLTVMRDKFGFGHIRLVRALDGMNGLLDEITAGRITHEDLVQVLIDEAHIDLRVKPITEKER